VSLALRCGVDPLAITHQMKGIRCLSCTKRQGVTSLSCPDAIAKTIEKAMMLNGFFKAGKTPDLTPLKAEERKKQPGNGKSKHPAESVFCPECRKPISFAEGCFVCKHCGYSKCG
jgi:ribonucleoside-diphosphate reductase alpha chain